MTEKIMKSDHRRDTDTKKFIILGQARTGSSLLKELLDSHPDIQCEGELFNPTCKYLQQSLALQFLQWYPFPYLNYRKSLSMKPMYGCKIQPHQIKFFHTRITQLQKKGWKIIHIQRKNVLRQVLSALIAQKTGCWHRNAQDDTPVYSVRITPSELLPAVAWRLRQGERESALLEEIPHFSVLYEEDLLHEENRDAVATFLLSYLELPWYAMSSNFARTDPRAYSEIIESWDELRRGIQTIFRDFWEE